MLSKIPTQIEGMKKEELDEEKLGAGIIAIKPFYIV